MTIQRQYSLPNCTLILEGLTDSATSGSSDYRPLMSILINAECRLAGREQPLTGGREFFESLVGEVSRYAQEFLSGVPHAAVQTARFPLVQLKKLDANLHRLIVQSPQSGATAALSPSPIQIDLNTVQLFDLVEAIDQFFADTRTLPEFSLNLTPVSKKQAATYEPVARRAMPAAIGASSLALAAIAFLFVPPATVRRPILEAQPQSSSSNATSTPSGTGSPAPGSAPTALSDPTQIETLRWKLYEQVDKTWNRNGSPSETALFRVNVDPQGTIVGYKQENQAALDYVEKTPLSELVRKQPEGGTTPAEKVAQYSVAFTTAGELQVEPWREASATPTSPPNITDPAVLDELKQKLSEKLDRDWQEKKSPSERELIYRVNVTSDGAIASYEALNPPAFYHKEETPLSSVPLSSVASSPSPDSAATQKPVAKFRVVFKPSGELEVNPF